MSTISGIGAKGEKAKNKFTSININNIYKGTSTAPQKQAGKNSFKCIAKIQFSILLLPKFSVFGCNIVIPVIYDLYSTVSKPVV